MNMQPQETMGDTVVTRHGPIRGRRDESGAAAWLGIPYARAPVGELRWKAPRDPEPWKDVLETFDFRNASVQLQGGEPFGSEDCLYLNVWRPALRSSKLPVFVFLHGGGNAVGSGRDFHGGRLAAETNSVVITINYRLGAMGFFRHPALRTGDPLDDSGNYGLLDILHALRWVRDHADRFGGDPVNVTLGGQSAGARNALAAYLSPLGRGLFRKLFVLSGGLTTSPPELGTAKAEELLAALLVRSGEAGSALEALAWAASRTSGDIADFLRRQDAALFAASMGDIALRMSSFPQLFEDGTVLPAGGFAALDRAYEPLPVILGSTADEFSVFAMSDPYFAADMAPCDSDRGTLYEASVQYGSELYASFNAERVAAKLAAAVPGMDIYAYRFAWGTEDGVVDPLLRRSFGAYHGADLPFYSGAFDSVRQMFPQGWITEENRPGREALAALMRGYLANFLHTRQPNGAGLPAWKPWGGSTELLRLDANREKASAAMVPGLPLEDIRLRMDRDPRLTAEQCDWCWSYLFAGRFFDPGQRADTASASNRENKKGHLQ